LIDYIGIAGPEGRPRLAPIFLKTRPAIFEHFYALLRDFDFHIQAPGLGDTVYVRSCFRPRQVKTEMIVEKPAAVRNGA